MLTQDDIDVLMNGAAITFEPPKPASEWRSIRLYPDSTYLQAEWRRAVNVVRSTKRGWILDHPVEKVAA